MEKSFKDRNPDVDMDEIARNPNVPDDVKAAISDAFSFAIEEEFPTGDDNDYASTGLDDVDDFLNENNDNHPVDAIGRKSRRRRFHENDEDWSATCKVKRPVRKRKEKPATINGNESQSKSLRTPKKVKIELETEMESSIPCQDVRSMQSLVKLEKLEIEPVEEMIPVEPKAEMVAVTTTPIKTPMRTPRKRQTDNRSRVVRVGANGKPVSSLEKILETIETVVLGLDETSRNINGNNLNNPFERLFIYNDQLLDPQMKKAVEALDAVIESKSKLMNKNLDFSTPSVTVTQTLTTVPTIKATPLPNKAPPPTAPSIMNSSKGTSTSPSK